MRAENEMDQRHLFQFQSHQHFFGGEAGSALTTVKLWVGWEKKLQLLLSRPLMVLKAKLVNARSSRERNYMSAAAAAFGNGLFTNCKKTFLEKRHEELLIIFWPELGSDTIWLVWLQASR